MIARLVSGPGLWSALLLLGIGGASRAIASPAAAPTALAPLPESISQRLAHRRYSTVIERTQSMVTNPATRALVERHGLNILNLTWEDVGRFENSSVGPNISDMTIQVTQTAPDGGRDQAHLMPIIRHPNFEDITADVPLNRFFVLVGNQAGDDLRRVPLAEVLGDIPAYLSQADDWANHSPSLLAERDSHVLVSAQAAFLPIPRQGTATFNPVLFNYQSYPGDPAVLTLLATREGTSITVIENTPADAVDADSPLGAWGQRLFFNRQGERASLTGQRLSDFQANPTDPAPDLAPAAAGETGLNMVMLIQVPLKQQHPPELVGAPMMLLSAPEMEYQESDIEAAVIGSGPVEGPFYETKGLSLERHPDFPIRVTVQFYQATSNGAVSEQDITAIRTQIDRVYEDADYVGSLVVDGVTDRPTEFDGPRQEPEDWWREFWQHHRDRILGN
jgi:hypothetical protein